MSLTKCAEDHLYSSKRYGNTCPYCSKKVLLASDKDSDVMDEINLTDIEKVSFKDLPTGWLVCVSGNAKGNDYKIKSLKTYLGRSHNMDMRVLGDNYIERHNHAVFVYDSKKRKTILLPGDSQGAIYVNGEIVHSPIELSKYDSIEMGKSEFLFIPLCGENLEWIPVDGIPYEVVTKKINKSNYIGVVNKNIKEKNNINEIEETENVENTTSDKENGNDVELNLKNSNTEKEQM
jgi:hypothetical protein